MPLRQTQGHSREAAIAPFRALETRNQGGGVDVTGTLEIVGSSTDMDNLVTINAASKKRHFYVNGANDKLVLRYVKLVGGDVSSYSWFSCGWWIHIYS